MRCLYKPSQLPTSGSHVPSPTASAGEFAQFEPVASFPTPANFNAHEKVLVVYHNLGKVAAKGERIDIDLPIIHRSIPAADATR